MVLPPLYVILDVETCRERRRDPLAIARAFLEAGARLIQVRTKELSSAAFLGLARAVVDEAHACGASVIINDRADIARLSGADGVHVGQDDLPAPAVRVLMPDGIVGLSTHSEPQLESAIQEPVDYIAVGPVFGTGTKNTGYAPKGLAFVRWAGSRTTRPIVAIGGITLDRAPAVLAAGAASVAVISDLLTADPASRVAAYLAALSRARS